MHQLVNKQHFDNIKMPHGTNVKKKSFIIVLYKKFPEKHIFLSE